MIEVRGVRWLTSVEAARMLGISVNALRSRRGREGAEHPEYVSSGSAVLYEETAITTYGHAWIDGRR